MSEVGYLTKTVSLPTYKNMKIKMIEEEFMIKLSQEERNRIHAQETEMSVDRCGRAIILSHL